MDSLKAGFPCDRTRYTLSHPLHLRLNSFILISSVDKSAATPAQLKQDAPFGKKTFVFSKVIV